MFRTERSGLALTVVFVAVCFLVRLRQKSKKDSTLSSPSLKEMLDLS
jgi:hypothetical protein